MSSTADYRNGFACESLKDISKKKKKVEKLLRKEKPKSRLNHRYISNRSDKYFRLYGEAYNLKCAYCGVSSDIHGINSFEIDHFVCKAHNLNPDESDRIDNLVFACDCCNHSKRDFIVPESHLSVLHPDLDKLGFVFYRDTDFSIKISSEYSDDEVVLRFYEKLKLYFQARRIDFLLLESLSLYRLLKSHNLDSSASRLNEIVSSLRDRRNNLSWGYGEQ